MGQEGALMIPAEPDPAVAHVLGFDVVAILGGENPVPCLSLVKVCHKPESAGLDPLVECGTHLGRDAVLGQDENTAPDGIFGKRRELTRGTHVDGVVWDAPRLAPHPHEDDVVHRSIFEHENGGLDLRVVLHDLVGGTDADGGGKLLLGVQR